VEKKTPCNALLHLLLLLVYLDTPCASTLLREERDTPCNALPPAPDVGVAGYTLHVHAAGGGKGYILQCTSTCSCCRSSWIHPAALLVVEKDMIPCTPTLQSVERDTPSTSILYIATVIMERDTVQCTMHVLTAGKKKRHAKNH
jgi:hypothetical protein